MPTATNPSRSSFVLRGRYSANVVQRDSNDKAIAVLCRTCFLGTAVTKASPVVSVAITPIAHRGHIVMFSISPLMVSTWRISSSLAAATNRAEENAHSMPSLYTASSALSPGSS